MKKLAIGIVGILLISSTVSIVAQSTVSNIKTVTADTVFVNGQRQIAYTSIPATIQYSVSNQYPNFTPVKMVTEILSNGQSTYFINIENDTRIIALMSTVDGELTLQSNSRKN